VNQFHTSQLLELIVPLIRFAPIGVAPVVGRKGGKKMSVASTDFVSQLLQTPSLVGSELEDSQDVLLEEHIKFAFNGNVSLFDFSTPSLYGG